MSASAHVNWFTAFPLVALTSWLAISTTASCSSSADVCVPGATQVCACPGGENGAQACNADGNGFEACLCPGDDDGPSAGAPADGGGPPSSGGAPPTNGGAPPTNGGAPPSNGGSPGDGGAGATGGDGGGGEGGSGGGGELVCADLNPKCPAADPVACECAGCSSVCAESDCVCPSCANDSWCIDPTHCTADGVCDPFEEGCICPDCADHPSCEDTPPPVECFNESLEVDAPGNNALAGLGLCTTAQIDSFYTVCFGPSSTTTTCNAFFDNAANAGCLGCLFEVNANGNSAGGTPPLLGYADSNGTDYILANQAACDAAAKGLPACGGPVSDVTLCYFSTCADCTTQADFGACTADAVTPPNTCSTIAVPASCDPVVDDPIAPECDGAGFEELYTNVSTFMCGP